MYKRLLFITISLVVVTLPGCGSGGSSVPPIIQPPVTPSFTISFSPSSVSLRQGGSQAVQVTITPKNGFSDPVSLSILKLPTGISVSPSPLSLSATTPGTLTFNADGHAILQPTSVTAEAVSSSLTVDSTLSVNVTGNPVSNAIYDVGGTIVRGFYDEARQLLFASNPGLNEIDVLAGKDMTVLHRIAAAQPWSIDQMADGKTLVIGSQTQQIFTLDEDTLALKSHPFAASPYGTSLFFTGVTAMANGKVLIIGKEQGIDSNDLLDGGQYLVEWDSLSDTFTVKTGLFDNVLTLDRIARSADHKHAAFLVDQFYSYDSDSDTISSVPSSAVQNSNPGDVIAAVLNGDGSKIAVISAYDVTFMDSALNVLGTVAIPGAFQSVRTSAMFSADGSAFYLQYADPIAIEKIDATNFQALGYVESDVSPQDNAQRLLAIDRSGRIFAGNGPYIRLTDDSRLTPTPTDPHGEVGINACYGFAASLPLNQSVQWTPVSNNVSYYVNGQPAPWLQDGSAVTLPPGNTPSLANLACVDLKGDEEIVPDEVSYGTGVLGLSGNLLPPTGNPPAIVYGWGFIESSSEIPSVSIGGQSAKVGITGDTQGAIQLSDIHVPNGVPGSTVEVTVSGSLGSATFTHAAAYYDAPVILTTTGIEAILFDTHRNVLYALKPTEIDVLDATSNHWKTPITLPTSQTYSTIALSPDGAYLVVGGGPSGIAVLNPDSPTQIGTVPGNVIVSSGSIAISNTDQAYFPGSYYLTKVDLKTLAVSYLTSNYSGFFGYLRASADGTAIFGAWMNNSGGTVYSLNTTTDELSQESFGYLFWSDLAVASDGSRFAAISGSPASAGDFVGFFDKDLRLIATTAYPLMSPGDDTQVLGAAFSPGGKVLLVPLGDSIEFWDVTTDRLRARLMTPEELITFQYPENPASVMMAMNVIGDTVYAVSKSGLTVIKLPGPADSMPAYNWKSMALPAATQPARALSAVRPNHNSLSQ